jgi:hypothetical protein
MAPKSKSTKSKSRKSKSKNSDYESCKSKAIDKVMKLYERGNLIIRGRKVSNRKQAIAIALQQSESNCKSKMNGSDIKNMETKVTSANDYSRFTYSDLKRILFLYNYYIKNKKYRKAIILQMKIINYLLFIKNNMKSSYRKLLSKSFE